MIPKRGEFGEPVKPDDFGAETDCGLSDAGDTVFGLTLSALTERGAACVNALDGCDPDKLGELVRAAWKVIEQADSEPLDIICLNIERMQKALDAFTERQE